MRYFLFGRPFRLMPTSGLYFLLLGQGIILTSNTVGQCLQPWPTHPLTWLLWLLVMGTLGLLALVFQAAVREYAGRSGGRCAPTGDAAGHYRVGSHRPSARALHQSRAVRVD